MADNPNKTEYALTVRLTVFAPSQSGALAEVEKRLAHEGGYTHDPFLMVLVDSAIKPTPRR